MRNVRLSVVTFFALCVLSSGAAAQDDRGVPIELDMYAGGYYTQLDGFSDRYGSGLMPLFGGGISLPIHRGRRGVAITGGASYASASGNPAIAGAETSAFEYRRRSFSAGLRYDVPLDNRNTVGIAIGLSRSYITETGNVRFGPESGSGYEARVHGSYGFRFGIGGERALPLQNFSIVLWSTRTFAPNLGNDRILGDLNRPGRNANSFTLRIGLRYRLLLPDPNKASNDAL